MSDLMFTPDHEWLAIEGDVVTIGITDHAQGQLGDIVFVELPGEGDALSAGDEAAVIESVKAAGEIKVPIAGTVVAVNEALADAPETVNQDPLGEGWFFKIRIDGALDAGDFLDESGYLALVADES